MSEAVSRAGNSESVEPPKLRHEFVGMMFAVAVGEVGVQAAGLFRAGPVVEYLPAYSHLILATFVIAASWVGWTRSLSPGGQRDVEGVFEWEFLVLLMDVVLVILYFILARSADIGKDERHPSFTPAYDVARLVGFIFLLYLFWDVLTKICMFEKPVGEAETSWWKAWSSVDGPRMIPTAICFALAGVFAGYAKKIETSRIWTVDLSLVLLILLFRALKDFISARYPRPAGPIYSAQEIGKRKKVAFICFVGMSVAFLGSVRL